jgi:hypothetical protein
LARYSSLRWDIIAIHKGVGVRVYLKVYHVDEEVLVAVCDEGLLEKEFSEGDVHLKVSKNFYGEEHADYDEVASALGEATIANLVGKQSVACAVENGFVDAKDVIFIEGVPHVQMVCM